MILRSIYFLKKLEQQVELFRRDEKFQPTFNINRCLQGDKND